MTTTSWAPLLSGPLAREAEEAVSHIATDLVRFATSGPTDSEGVPPRYPLVGLEGLAGIALFLEFLDRSRGTAELGEAIGFALGRATDELREVQAHSGLHGGFSGLAWVVEHLQGRDPDPEDPGGAIAQQLFEHLAQAPWNRDYDLIGGLCGFGVWALERMPRPLGAESLARVVRQLGELALSVPEGLTWRTPRHLIPLHQQHLFPDGNFNLGVAHGVPGVIAVLAEAYAMGVERPLAGRLLEQAVPWLLAQRLAPPSDSRFPFCVAPGFDPAPGGLAWCYGDLGISVALLGASRRVGRSDWEKEAIDLGLGVAARGLPDWSGTRQGDACLCHGAAGNGHLFNRLHRATGDARFAEAAITWFKQALSLRNSEHGFGGFRFWDSDSEGNMTQEPMLGLLNGSAGVGLALLAATSDTEPVWDRLLLAAVPDSCEPV